jgi:hypothetical protein
VPIYFPTTFRSASLILSCQPDLVERTLKKPKAKREHRQIPILFFRGEVASRPGFTAGLFAARNSN